MLLAKDIRDRERGGRAEIRVVEGEAESNSPHNMEILNGVLGERTSRLTDGPPDATVDQQQKSNLTLYQWATAVMRIHSCPVWVLHVSSYLLVPYFPSVSDNDGQMKVTEVATRPLIQDLLNHDVSVWYNFYRGRFNDGCQCHYKTWMSLYCLKSQTLVTAVWTQ